MPSLPNPYQVLRVSTSAPIAEIVAAAMAVIEAEPSEELKQHYRAAIEALTTHAAERDYHRFWEPPGSIYRDAPETEFVGRYGPNPTDRDALFRRVRQFLDQECSGERLFDALVPTPEAPAHIADCHPAGTPESPLSLPFDPASFFC